MFSGIAKISRKYQEKILMNENLKFSAGVPFAFIPSAPASQIDLGKWNLWETMVMSFNPSNINKFLNESKVEFPLRSKIKWEGLIPLESTYFFMDRGSL